MVYLADPAPKVSITCGHNVALVLAYPFTDAVICISSLVRAGQLLQPRILQKGQTISISWPVIKPSRNLVSAIRMMVEARD